MDHQEILMDILIQVKNEKKNQLINDYGLLTGLTGTAIFLAEYAKIDNSCRVDVEDHVEAIFHSIENAFAIETYCAGIAGACLGINYVYEELLNDDSFDFVSEEINDFIYNRFLDCLENGNIDFLHGGIGIAFYYLKRYEVNDPSAKPAIAKLLAYLKQNAVREGNKIKWLQKTGDCNYNISLSHGMSSIIIFLCRLTKLDIEEFNVDSSDLLTGAIIYLLDQQIDHNIYGSYFPNTSKECDHNKSRLAWCYGDLGVAKAILEASNTLHQPEWERKALEIFDFSATRLDLKENLVLDCSICHGTAGLAVFYYELFLQTRKEAYQVTANYWLDKTIQLYQQQKVFYEFNESRYDQSRISFLEGTVGIGLAILLIKFNVHSGWPKFLLL